jgi:hypothetical protein
MTASEVKKLSFVTDEGFRLKISPKKAMNTYVLNAALQALKTEGYSFYRLFEGGYIYAQKEN